MKHFLFMHFELLTISVMIKFQLHTFTEYPMFEGETCQCWQLYVRPYFAASTCFFYIRTPFIRNTWLRFGSNVFAISEPIWVRPKQSPPEWSPCPETHLKHVFEKVGGIRWLKINPNIRNSQAEIQVSVSYFKKACIHLQASIWDRV